MQRDYKKGDEMFDLTGIQWLILLFSAVNVGFAKTGLQGATMPAIIFIASAFGGQLSSAIMLVMLIIGDMFAIKEYGRNIKVKRILNLMPATIVGVILGTIIGSRINDGQFKMLMAILVIISLIVLILQEFGKNSFEIPENKMVSSIAGALSGLSSMIGNVAGPIFNVYILSKNLKKEAMISSIAWFFVFLNLIKLPFHIFVWHTFSLKIIVLGVMMLPIIYIGSKLGVTLIQKINEDTYRILMIVVTAIGAINLIF